VDSIPLPTDNFHVTLTLLGVVLVVLSCEPSDRVHRLNVDIIRASGEREELETKKKWAENDRAAYENGVALLGKYKRWQWKPVQALNPNTEEAKLYSEMTGRVIEPNIAELWVQLDSPEEAKAKKDRAVQEMQTRLDKASEELKATSRQLQATETSLHAKDRELSQTHRFVRKLNVIAFVGRLLGGILIVVGLTKWWSAQRREDTILRNEAERRRGLAS
jgi:hypothetical protein